MGEPHLGGGAPRPFGHLLAGGASSVAASGGIHGLAHVTGGGIAGNLARVLPEGNRAVIVSVAWEVPRYSGYCRNGGHAR